jgi:hypothetical protein
MSYHDMRYHALCVGADRGQSNFGEDTSGLLQLGGTRNLGYLPTSYFVCCLNNLH